MEYSSKQEMIRIRTIVRKGVSFVLGTLRHGVATPFVCRRVLGTINKG